MAAAAPTEAEVARAKAQIKAGMLMGLESSSARAEYMARQLLLFDKLIDTKEVVARIEAVTAEDARTLAARLLTARAAAMYDADLPETGGAASMAKYAAAEAASHALDAAIQAHGGNGMATEYGLATLSGLVRLFRIAPVSSEMALNHIAQHELGLPKSY